MDQHVPEQSLAMYRSVLLEMLPEVGAVARQVRAGYALSSAGGCVL